MENKEYSRRKFMNKCLSAGSMFLGSAIFLNSCNSERSGGEEKKQSTGENPCDDLTDVSAEEIEKRKKFGYVTKSVVPGSFCGNCALFLLSKTENGCGGCVLFKGPVQTEGHCIQYAQKV